MRVFDCSFVFVFLILAGEVVRAQDELYLQRDVQKGKITEISPTAIKYQNGQQSSQSLLLPTEKVLFVINSRGNFLVPSKLDNNSYTQQRITHFIAADTSYTLADQLFLSPDIRIEGHITREDNDYLYLSDTGKIARKHLVAVIYGNGTHKIFGPADTVAAVLANFQHAPLPSSIPGTPVPMATPVATVNTASDNGTTKTSGQLPDSAATSQEFARLAPDVSRKEFEDKATQKTIQFTQYLKILCDKTADYEEINKAINQAITLFVNEGAMIETSSNNRNTISRLKVRDYLLKVKRIQYDKIEIEWTHVQYVSDLKPGPDGNFYGVVSFEQEFRGYRDGKLVYSDITRKNATVVLKTYQKNYEGTTKSIWDVLLSDIGVMSTKSL